MISGVGKELKQKTGEVRGAKKKGSNIALIQRHKLLRLIPED